MRKPPWLPLGEAMGCIPRRSACKGHSCRPAGGASPLLQRCPNHETKPGKLVAFRASAGLGRRGRPLAPTHTPPGERCRVPLRQSAAIADSAGHTAPSVLQAWLSVKAPVHAPAGRSRPFAYGRSAFLLWKALRLSAASVPAARGGIRGKNLLCAQRVKN